MTVLGPGRSARQSARSWPKPMACKGGFSYVEVLVATVLIAVCLVPALQALQPALLSTRVREAYTVDHLALRSKMEEVLAEPFAHLAAAEAAAGSYLVPTHYSDTITATDGRLISRNVFMAKYDGDGDGTPDPGLLMVKVEILGTLYRFFTLASDD